MSHVQMRLVFTGCALLVWCVPHASAQLSGLWTISVNTCCTVQAGTECETDVFKIPVVQNGDQLSGSSTDVGDVPEACGNLACTPNTPSCDLPNELTGTVSGAGVDVTLTRQQTLSASCLVMGSTCALQLTSNDVVHAQGTREGSSISGSFTAQNNRSCQLTGGAHCAMGQCGGDVPCTGTFDIAIGNSCTGDCAGDNQVTVDELLMIVNVALGNLYVGSCGAADSNADRLITVDEVLVSVNRALGGCT